MVKHIDVKCPQTLLVYIPRVPWGAVYCYAGRVCLCGTCISRCPRIVMWSRCATHNYEGLGSIHDESRYLKPEGPNRRPNRTLELIIKNACIGTISWFFKIFTATTDYSAFCKLIDMSTRKKIVFRWDARRFASSHNGQQYFSMIVPDIKVNFVCVKIFVNLYFIEPWTGTMQ